MVTIAALLPLIAPLVAVTTWLVPPVVLVVKATVATPLVVVDVVDANDPPFVDVQVTVCPEVVTALSFASTSFAVIVTVLPPPRPTTRWR